MFSKPLDQRIKAQVYDTLTSGQEPSILKLKNIYLQYIQKGQYEDLKEVVRVLKFMIKDKLPAKPKFYALLLIKDFMETQKKPVVEYFIKKLMSRFFLIAQFESKSADIRRGQRCLKRYYESNEPENLEFSQKFFILLLECWKHWSQLFANEYKKIKEKCEKIRPLFPINDLYYDHFEDLRIENSGQLAQNQRPRPSEPEQEPAEYLPHFSPDNQESLPSSALQESEAKPRPSLPKSGISTSKVTEESRLVGLRRLLHEFSRNGKPSFDAGIEQLSRAIDNELGLNARLLREAAQRSPPEPLLKQSLSREAECVKGFRLALEQYQRGLLDFEDFKQAAEAALGKSQSSPFPSNVSQSKLLPKFSVSSPIEDEQGQPINRSKARTFDSTPKLGSKGQQPLSEKETVLPRLSERQQGGSGAGPGRTSEHSRSTEPIVIRDEGSRVPPRKGSKDDLQKAAISLSVPVQSSKRRFSDIGRSLTESDPARKDEGVATEQLERPDSDYWNFGRPFGEKRPFGENVFASFENFAKKSDEINQPLGKPETKGQKNAQANAFEKAEPVSFPLFDSPQEIQIPMHDYDSEAYIEQNFPSHKLDDPFNFEATMPVIPEESREDFEGSKISGSRAFEPVSLSRKLPRANQETGKPSVTFSSEFNTPMAFEDFRAYEQSEDVRNSFHPSRQITQSEFRSPKDEQVTGKQTLTSTMPIINTKVSAGPIFGQEEPVQKPRVSQSQGNQKQSQVKMPEDFARAEREAKYERSRRQQSSSHPRQQNSQQHKEKDSAESLPSKPPLIVKSEGRHLSFQTPQDNKASPFDAFEENKAKSQPAEFPGKSGGDFAYKSEQPVPSNKELLFGGEVRIDPFAFQSEQKEATPGQNAPLVRSKRPSRHSNKGPLIEQPPFPEVPTVSEREKETPVADEKRLREPSLSSIENVHKSKFSIGKIEANAQLANPIPEFESQISDPHKKFEQEAKETFPELPNKIQENFDSMGSNRMQSPKVASSKKVISAFAKVRKSKDQDQSLGSAAANPLDPFDRHSGSFDHRQHYLKQATANFPQELPESEKFDSNKLIKPNFDEPNLAREEKPSVKKEGVNDEDERNRLKSLQFKKRAEENQNEGVIKIRKVENKERLISKKNENLAGSLSEDIERELVELKVQNEMLRQQCELLFSHLASKEQREAQHRLAKNSLEEAQKSDSELIGGIETKIIERKNQLLMRENNMLIKLNKELLGQQKFSNVRQIEENNLYKKLSKELQFYTDELKQELGGLSRQRAAEIEAKSKGKCPGGRSARNRGN